MKTIIVELRSKGFAKYTVCDVELLRELHHNVTLSIAPRDNSDRIYFNIGRDDGFKLVSELLKHLTEDL